MSIPSAFCISMLGLFSFLAESSSAQSNSSYQQNMSQEMMTFKPSDYKHQHLKQSKIAGFNWAKAGRVAIAVVGVLGFIGMAFWLGQKTSGIGLKVLIGAGALFLALGWAFLFMLMDAYSFDTWNIDQKRANNRLRSLASQLQVEVMLVLLPADENYRLGLIGDTKRLMIVDYKNDQGWLIGNNQVKTLSAMPGEGKSPDAGALQLFTSESLKSPVKQVLLLELTHQQPTEIWLSYVNYYENAENFAYSFQQIQPLDAN